MFATIKKMTVLAVVVGGWMITATAGARPTDANRLAELRRQMVKLERHLAGIEDVLADLGDQARAAHADYVEAMGMFDQTGDRAYYFISRDAVARTRVISAAHAHWTTVKEETMARIEYVLEQIEQLEAAAARPTITVNGPTVTTNGPGDPGPVNPPAEPRPRPTFGTSNLPTISTNDAADAGEVSRPPTPVPSPQLEGFGGAQGLSKATRNP